MSFNDLPSERAPRRLDIFRDRHEGVIGRASLVNANPATNAYVSHAESFVQRSNDRPSLFSFSSALPASLPGIGAARAASPRRVVSPPRHASHRAVSPRRVVSPPRHASHRAISPRRVVSPARRAPHRDLPQMPRLPSPQRFLVFDPMDVDVDLETKHTGSRCHSGYRSRRSRSRSHSGHRSRSRHSGHRVTHFKY